MDRFKEGYGFAAKNMGASFSAFQGESYVTGIDDVIRELTSDVNSFEDISTGIKQLKGNLAESWHAGTYNINAAVQGSEVRMSVLESNSFASVDVLGSEGTAFGLKYYKNAVASANTQSASYFETYNEYIADFKRKGLSYPTIEEYLSARGIPEDVVLTDPIYLGQIRIIPSDQLQIAKEFLEKKIAKLELTRPDEVKRYQDTLDFLNDKIETSDGTASVPLSEEEALQLAKLAKEGGFDPDDYDFNTESLVEAKYVMEQAFKAGMSAAIITMVLKLAPEIYKAVDLLVREGHVDRDDFKRLGVAAFSGASEGFLRGSIAAAITTLGQAGLLGEAFKDVKPGVVGAMTVIVLDTIKSAYLVSTGEMTNGEMTDKLVRSIYASTGALVLGGLAQVLLVKAPLIGYMIGSFVGSILGSFAYSLSYKTYISFAIDTGFTFFGVVDQNYVLPEEVLNDLGMKVFEYEQFYPTEFSAHNFEPQSFEAIQFNAKTIEMTILRRGVIGVNQIGYVL